MNAIKSTFLSGVFVAFLALQAQAADLNGTSLKDAPIVPPPPSWAGWYFGGHVGGGFNDNDSTLIIDDVAFAPDEDRAQWLGGVHLGYNFDRYGGGWLWGIEGDVSFADNIDYLASIRGRLGFTNNEVLFYATAGGAFTSFGNGLGDSDDETGWVVGLGIEGKVYRQVSLGLEALYYDFGDGDTIDLGGGDSFIEADPNFWVVRARLSYHFDSGYDHFWK